MCVQAGLLVTCGAGQEQRWEMHACIRNAANALSDELGLEHAAARPVHPDVSK